MKYQHRQLASGRWGQFSLIEQMANIGSEVERAISWKKKKNDSYSQMAFERCLELLTLTIADPKNKDRLKELTRLKEVLLDYFLGDNQYSSSEELWHRYFTPFTWAARVTKR